MTKRSWLIVPSIVLIPVAYILLLLRPVPPHHGDGVFQDLSGWVGPLPERGYHIKFPEFDLSEPFTADYRLAGLTNVGSQCGVYLLIHDPDRKFPWGDKCSATKGRVALTMSKSTGEVVVSADAPLAEYVWWGFKDKHGLYDDKGGSHFDPDPKAEYRLHVSYEPTPELNGLKGRVYFNTGARYSGSRLR